MVLNGLSPTDIFDNVHPVFTSSTLIGFFESHWSYTTYFTPHVQLPLQEYETITASLDTMIATATVLFYLADRRLGTCTLCSEPRKQRKGRLLGNL